MVTFWPTTAMTRVIVFSRTKHGANKVRPSAAAGIATRRDSRQQIARPASGGARGFRPASCGVLVATDIARAASTSTHSHVVNLDLPNVPESYVHRIGRTARAGKDGIANLVL